MIIKIGKFQPYTMNSAMINLRLFYDSTIGFI